MKKMLSPGSLEMGWAGFGHPEQTEKPAETVNN
jgi:hypothetical protein